ncbi:high-affinity choline transporter 1 [Hydra vulgaris]|uniref:High-affinity choline transporter 1 n=1 Tax=Hydra vulgaris TaxID=6087 RepID=A0ABM4C4Y2_HYDVU
MAVNIVGVSGIIMFYVIILVIGLYAARKRNLSRRKLSINDNPEDHPEKSETSEVILAGRNIGIIIGSFTMTATWVGGGYINGTSEVVNKRGLAWAQSSWGYSLSLLIGGFLFAKIMRQRGYVTMLDPFQERYGSRIGGLMYFPAFLGELLWSAATLNSLGATISVVLSLDINVSVIVSACIAIFYTFFGGLWSVAYTDVAQLVCMFIGMWITIPFALTHKSVKSISLTSNHWAEGWVWSDAGIWIDYALLLICGGIPWQVYFQRVLSSKSEKQAQYLSFAAAAGCLLMSIPSILIGAVASSTDWKKTGYKEVATIRNDVLEFEYQKTMPLVLQYLTPPAISFIGLGAVSAAVMSSVDSSVLSASSMFAHNIYKMFLRPQARDKEMVWVIRVSILVIGIIATVIGLTVKSIYGLSILCSDLIYVVLFPQLVCVLYFRYANSYGALASFFVGMILRCLGGEDMLGMNAVIKYPYFDNANNTQKFPFRTFSMLVSTFVLLTTSIIVHLLFEKKKIPLKYDYAGCFASPIKPFCIKDMIVTSGVEISNSNKKFEDMKNEETELIHCANEENDIDQKLEKNGKCNEVNS